MARKTEPKIAILLGPHFSRLAATAGFMYGYREKTAEGLLLKPQHLIGVSAGGINAAAFTPWTEECATRTVDRIRDLRGSDFYSLNKELEVLGVLEGLGALTPFVPWHLIKTHWLRNLAKSTATASFIAAEGAFIRSLFHCKSIFSNDKLMSLLESNLRVNDIFKSDVKVQVISADINGNREDDKNVDLCSVSNFEPKDTDLPEQERNRRFLTGIVVGASITGFFKTRQNPEGHFLTDGAIYSAFPIDLAYKQGCDVIIMVKLRYAGQRYLERDYSRWMSALHRSMDIVIDNYSDSVIRGYFNINSDICQIEKMKYSLAVLKDAVKEVGPQMRLVMEKEICEIEKNLSVLTAHDKRYVNIVIIDSKEIEEFDFRHCSQKYNINAMNLGYDALNSSMRIIREQCG